jgi:hypothetical protein
VFPCHRCRRRFDFYIVLLHVLAAGEHRQRQNVTCGGGAGGRHERGGAGAGGGGAEEGSGETVRQDTLRSHAPR